MHCPRCGHPQTSDKIRFCTKCGLAMNDVKELLVPQMGEVKEKKKNKIGKAVRQGLGLMLFGFVLITILAILRDLSIVPQVFVKIAALVFCVGGVVRMSYPFVFGKNVSKEANYALREYDAAENNLTDKHTAGKSLPQAQYYPPVNFGAKNFDTAEMIQSPSVTENTTKLLKESLAQK